MIAQHLRSSGLLLVALLFLIAGVVDSRAACDDVKGGKPLASPPDLYGTKWILAGDRSGKIARFYDGSQDKVEPGQLKLDWEIAAPPDTKPDAAALAMLDRHRRVIAGFNGQFITFVRQVVIINDKGVAREQFKLHYTLEIGSDCQSLFGRALVNNNNDLAETARFNRSY